MEYESFFRDVVGITDESLLWAFCSNALGRKLRKGDRLVEAGSAQTMVNFLVSGLGRSFSVDAEGREITDCIVFRPGSVLVPSVDFDGPSTSTVEMLSEGEVVGVSVALVDELLQTSLAANHLYIQVLRQAWREHWEVRRLVSQKRGRDRYLWFLEKYPGVIDMVPNKYVASLLGMTPVSLSRLRTELRDEGVMQ